MCWKHLISYLDVYGVFGPRISVKRLLRGFVYAFLISSSRTSANITRTIMKETRPKDILIFRLLDIFYDSSCQSCSVATHRRLSTLRHVKRTICGKKSLVVQTKAKSEGLQWDYVSCGAIRCKKKTVNKWGPRRGKRKKRGKTKIGKRILAECVAHFLCTMRLHSFERQSLYL